MASKFPENAKQSFKCSRCGHMFSVQENAGECPICGFHCDSQSCQVVDASDEGY